MRGNGEFPSKFRPREPPGPPAVGTMGTLGGPTGETFFFQQLGSGRFFPPRLKQRDREAKLKSRRRFFDAGGINLHPVSFSRASFIHDAMIREARCPAFSIIIGRDAVLCGLMIQCARA